MTLSYKVGLILDASKHIKNDVFSFSHEEKMYVLDLSDSQVKVFNNEEYIETKRKYKTFDELKRRKDAETLWINEEGDKLGYGEEGRKKAIEDFNKKNKTSYS